MKASRSMALLLAAIFLTVGCQQAPATLTPAPAVTPPPPPEPRTVSALVGAGRNTEAINAFLPTLLTIHAGDTVEWTFNSDENHTVTFLGFFRRPSMIVRPSRAGPTDFVMNPVAYFPTRLPLTPIETYRGFRYMNSGLMADTPVVPGILTNDTFSATFDTVGRYSYICLLHRFMVGVVEVVPATTTEDAPSQVEIDTAVESELATLTENVAEIRETGTTITKDVNADGTTNWRTVVGGIGLDPRVELNEFFPQQLTIQVGDTVTWLSGTFHHVAFHPGREPPGWVTPEVDEQFEQQQNQLPQVVLWANPDVVFPAAPSEEFDGTGYFSSGLLGPNLPGGIEFSMTFSKAGTYEYVCAIHLDLGMTATVTVVEG